MSLDCRTSLTRPGEKKCSGISGFQCLEEKIDLTSEIDVDIQFIESQNLAL